MTSDDRIKQAQAAQQESRNKLKEFVEAATGGLVNASGWFGRPKQELEKAVMLGRAWEEVKDSPWYQHQQWRINLEITWAQEQLELGELDVTELRMYLRALRFLKLHIAEIEKNAEKATGVLSGRDKTIASEGEAFLARNAVVRK